MALNTFDDYVIAFQDTNEIEREIFLIRGVYMRFGEENLKELARRTQRNIDEFYDCASIEWFEKNLNRKKRGRKKIPHITAGESIAPIVAKKLENPYRKMNGWDLKKEGIRHDFC